MAIKHQLERLKALQSSLDSCTQCGYCTFWCPLYQENPEESSVARGKVTMLKDLLAGQQYFTDNCAEQIERCMLCGTCLEHCIEKVPTPSIMVTARADKVRIKGVKFPHNIIYGWLIPHRTVFGNVVRLASWFQGIFVPKPKGTIRHLPFFLSALGKGRYIPSIAPRFLRQQIPVLNSPPTNVDTKMRVGYFMGCMTDFVFPDIGKHTIDFLTRNGVEVVVPREQGCCGSAVYQGAGDLETGRKLADANVNAFNDADVEYVVCGCATCVSAMKDYVEFLADTSERRESYAKFIGKLKDITEFLVDVLKLPESVYQASSQARGKKITWHDPCHLNRYLRITQQPRQLIKSIPDTQYIEMTRPDWCCGMAGTFSIYYYELSKKIADKKIDSIMESGADIVATDCPGCQIQMIDNMTRRKLPVRVMHIVELLK